MAGISNNPNSPRQKMINLMYLVFIAMMALNVSSEVLDGFEIVENSLRKSTEEATKRNEDAKSDLNRAYEANPAKVKEWYEKGLDVKDRSDELYDYIDELKLRIVQKTDGAKGDVHNIEHKDDLEAASTVMLAPVVGAGRKLREHIETYRTDMGNLVDASKKNLFESMLTTETVRKAGIMATSWENAMFDNMPVAAAITILTKLQNDIRYVEGEVLSTLITNVDVGDYRVNKIKAFVIPKSQIVTSGAPYEAQIVLAAVDSTKQPEYYLGTTKLKDNIISIGTSGAGIGERTFAGYVMAEGEKYLFEEKYSVTESSATIAPLLMSFLYESIDNDLEMSMPGVPSGAVVPSISSGTVKFKEKNIWTVSGLDLAKAPEATITLTSNVSGRQSSESKVFKVRPLPDPQPFIAYKDANGSPRKFTGGLVAKRTLIEATGVQAAIDDGVLLVPHSVTGFTLVFIDGMGNSIPFVSNSQEFTPQQKERIRDLARGKRFYISTVKALNPAGRPVTIKYSMEVIVN
ncbi:MAG: gliding motility protein GldM [Tannerella sp.]|jgi:gliding motility-associated protein GldM|nr:gliding motility protein GldM [Tannerella sp.]